MILSMMLIYDQVISRKTTATSVPLKSPAVSIANDENIQVNEVGIDIGNAVMATPNSQSSQSSAGVIRIESSENLSSRRRNESEPLSKHDHNLERNYGSHDYTGYRSNVHRNIASKAPVKRSSSER